VTKFFSKVIKENKNLRTGIGYNVSYDEMIYGFADPEIAVGTSQGVDGKKSITVHGISRS
jgi:hypothetical protein